MSQVCMASVYALALGSCKDQVLGNRHRPAVYASSRAATFSVGSIWPVTLPRPCMTQTKKLYNLNWGVSTLTSHPRVGRVVLRASCFEWALSVALLCRIPPPYWALSYLRWWARCTRPNWLDQWHPPQCHCYDPITLVAWFAVAATLTILPDTYLSDLEVLLLNACCLHNRWMIDPWEIAHCPLIFLLDVSSVERYDTPRLHSMLAKFCHITERSYWYTTHRLRHIQEVLFNETSNMLKRRTVRTWRNIMISNCSAVCSVSLELRLALFFNFVQRARQGVQAWKMVHKFSSTTGIASGHGPGSQTYSFILPQASCLHAQYPHLPYRSDIPALVAHFFFSILSLVAMLHTK